MTMMNGSFPRLQRVSYLAINANNKLRAVTNSFNDLQTVAMRDTHPEHDVEDYQTGRINFNGNNEMRSIDASFNNVTFIARKLEFQQRRK